MPPNQHLMVGAGDAYRFAQGCPVATRKYGNDSYIAHQGDPDSFLVADAVTKDGTAGVRIAVWSCVFCGTPLVGLGTLDEKLGEQEFTWMERDVTLLEYSDE